MESKVSQDSSIDEKDRIIAYLRTVSVRNVPPGVSKERLKAIFERFGRVETVVMSSQTSACVVYKKPTSAEEAVKEINFSGHGPLLIDGAPIQVYLWSEIGLDTLETLFDTSDAECSIYVTNIARATTPQALKTYFSFFGGLKYETVKIEGIGGDDRRYAHLTYHHSIQRDMALQANGKNLDGNLLVVQPCFRRRQ